ncbi:MAG: hypothetical protein IMF07_08915 [Proteobacteria bacterium]|nr:hypothetical protein [Pseudomonadota bacterium]
MTHYTIITANETKERAHNIATDDTAGLLRVLSRDIDMEGGDSLHLFRLHEAETDEREDWAASLDDEDLAH